MKIWHLCVVQYYALVKIMVPCTSCVLSLRIVSLGTWAATWISQRLTMAKNKFKGQNSRNVFHMVRQKYFQGWKQGKIQSLLLVPGPPKPVTSHRWQHDLYTCCQGNSHHIPSIHWTYLYLWPCHQPYIQEKHRRRVPLLSVHQPRCTGGRK